MEDFMNSILKNKTADYQAPKAKFAVLESRVICQSNVSPASAFRLGDTKMDEEDM